MRGDTALARARRARIALLVAAALALALLRLPFLSLPLERDEGEYAYVAQRMLRGEVPYRDAFDQKPPGAFAAYALAFLVFGESVEAIRAFALLFVLATAATLHALARRLLGGLGAAAAVLLFAVGSADPRVLGMTANTEIFLLLPATAAALLALRARDEDRARWWLLCGALAAAACVFKPVALTSAGFAAGFAWAAGLRRRTPARSARAALLLGVGAAAVAAPLLACLAAAGALPAFLDAVWFHNLAYAGRASWREGLDSLRFALSLQAPGFWPQWALAATGLFLPAFARPGDRAFALGWLAASAAGVAVGLYFRPHYFVQLLPALALVAAVPIALAGRRLLARERWAPAAAGGIALGILCVGVPVAANVPTLAAGSPEARARRIYGLNPFPESRVFAEHIRGRSTPDDRVLVVGSEPQILFYAERRSATRYIIFYPLTGDYADAARRQREVAAALRAAPPRYAVWVNLPPSLLLTPDSPRLVFDAAAELLRGSYRVELLARPDPAGGWRFVSGAEAHRMALRDDGFLRRPWITLWRRAGAAAGG